jgi:hypothetical protein
MVDATLRIKNLSIALEALSRIAITDGRYNHFERIQELLNEEIQKAQKETQWPRRGSAKPETQYNPFTNNEDDIPF